VVKFYIVLLNCIVCS